MIRPILIHPDPRLKKACDPVAEITDEVRRLAADMLETVEAECILLADRAYDSDALRIEMAERGAWANIRTMPNRIKVFAFDRRVYRQRNEVERFLNKLKHFRAIATRYDKRDDNFLASVQLASIRIWLRSYESVT